MTYLNAMVVVQEQAESKPVDVTTMVEAGMVVGIEDMTTAELVEDAVPFADVDGVAIPPDKLALEDVEEEVVVEGRSAVDQQQPYGMPSVHTDGDSRILASILKSSLGSSGKIAT